MIFIIIFIINLLAVIPLISLFKPQSITKYIIGSFVIFCTFIILIGNILGLFSQLNNIIAWLLCHICLLLFSWFLWLVYKKPRLFSFKNPIKYFKVFSLFEKVLLASFFSVLIACYLVLVYLIIIVPPNNNDSMLVHLVRVGYWIQQGSFKPWDALIERQIIYPYNAQIILTWLSLFLKNDLLTPFLQFFCVVFSAASIYGISRILGANRFISLIIGGFYLTFPQVILQSTTTQNDLVITFFITAGTLFLLDWLKSEFHSQSSLVLCGASYAISLGIKATSYYFYVGLGFSLLVLLVSRRILIRKAALLVGMIIIAFIPLSSIAYIINYSTFGTPLGDAGFLKTESGVVDQGSLIEKNRINSFRLIYQMTSLDGYPFSIQKKFTEIKKNFAENRPNLFDTSLKYIKDPGGETFNLDGFIINSEDLSWFGPIFLLLTVPAICVSFYQIIRKKNHFLFILITSGIISFMLIPILRPGWDPYQGRYVNTAVAILFPVVSTIFNRNFLSKIVISLLIPFALIPLIYTTFVNDSKPLLTQSIRSVDCAKSFFNHVQCCLEYILPDSVIDGNLPEKESILIFNSRVARQTYTTRSQFPIFDFIEKLPADSKIAIVLNHGDWEYPYFGKNYQFEVIPIADPGKLCQKELVRMDADFLVIHNRVFDHSIIAQSYNVVHEIVYKEGDQNWIIYGR